MARRRMRRKTVVAALERMGAGRTLGAIIDAPDECVQRLVGSWPAYAKAERVAALGLPRNPPLDEVVRQYIEDYVDR